MITFTPDEITKGSWIKISDRGKVFQLALYPDGKLKEQWLFKPTESWEGAWKIFDEGKQLEIRVGAYLLFARATVGNIYDGDEYDQDTYPPQAGPFSYKLIHLPDEFL
jgi:hypothetical protein